MKIENCMNIPDKKMSFYSHQNALVGSNKGMGSYTHVVFNVHAKNESTQERLQKDG